MKTINVRWSVLMLSTIFLLSCDDDPISEEGNNEIKITVQFETAAKEIAENGGEQTIFLKLNKPALADAIITLQPGDHFSERLQTLPALENGFIHIPILKGNTGAALKLIPIDNPENDGQQIVNVKFYNLASPFTAGVPGQLNITVKDDESEPHLESVANFIVQDVTLDEKNSTGIEYQVHLSEAVAGHIRITLSAEKGVYGSDFLTEPAAENNLLTLDLVQGSRVVGFKVRPVDNNLITGELKVKFTISETSGSAKKGTALEQVLTIKDDELSGKPRGYEVTAGNSALNKFYEYDALGRVSKVNWESYTPFRSYGTDTYIYDNAGQLTRIDKNGGKQVIYRRENGRIVRSDEEVSGVIRNYTLYDYDDHGNVSGVVSYHKQSDGSFAKGMTVVYLYFPDGNIYKSLLYQDNADPEQEPILLSTKTYDNYIDAPNPFPMTEVLPTIKMQSKLATTYRLEETETDQTYHMTYEFREDGQPGKRIATAPGDTQTAVYHYY